MTMTDYQKLIQIMKQEMLQMHQHALPRIEIWYKFKRLGNTNYGNNRKCGSFQVSVRQDELLQYVRIF